MKLFRELFTEIRLYHDSGHNAICPS